MFPPRFERMFQQLSAFYRSHSSQQPGCRISSFRCRVDEDWRVINDCRNLNNQERVAGECGGVEGRRTEEKSEREMDDYPKSSVLN